jgi:hypothetical protein
VVEFKVAVRTVLSIVHGVIYQPPSRADRAFVAQKQIYASHYYDGSLAMATALSATENGAPLTYSSTPIAREAMCCAAASAD